MHQMCMTLKTSILLSYCLKTRLHIVRQSIMACTLIGCIQKKCEGSFQHTFMGYLKIMLLQEFLQQIHIVVAGTVHCSDNIDECPQSASSKGEEFGNTQT